MFLRKHDFRSLALLTEISNIRKCTAASRGKVPEALQKAAEKACETLVRTLESDRKQKAGKRFRAKSTSKGGKLTPYQGRSRAFGYFWCDSCRCEWKNGNSFANKGQHCRNCGDLVFPYRQRPLKAQQPTQAHRNDQTIQKTPIASDMEALMAQMETLVIGATKSELSARCFAHAAKAQTKEHCDDIILGPE